jgi:hypothetical protein
MLIRIQRYLHTYKKATSLEKNIIDIIIFLVNNKKSEVVMDIDGTYYASLNDSHVILESGRLYIVDNNYFNIISIDNTIYSEIESKFIRRIRKDRVVLKTYILNKNKQSLDNVLLTIKTNNDIHRM